jgi:hypothetical protein
MKNLRLLIIVGGLTIVITSVAIAQTGNNYDLTWNSNYSGDVSSSGPYTLISTIGQPEASLVSGGAFELTGGFRSSDLSDLTEFKIFLPLVRR